MIPVIIFVYAVRRLRVFLRQNIVRLSFLLLFVILYGSITMYYFEQDAVGSGIKSVMDSLWFVVQTITTVGYGDTPIVTFWGKINAMVIMFSGIGILGFFTASVASVFIEYTLKKRYGEQELRMKNHVIICNWNPIAEEIVHEVLGEGMEPVLLAPLETSPMDKLEFVRGTSLHLADLKKVNIGEANAVIVLAEILADGDLAGGIDAKSVLSVMNIKKINPSVHVVVELLRTDSVENAKLAGADEVVVRGDFIAIIETILTARSGEEIFEDDLPAGFEGTRFGDLVAMMLEKSALPIALRLDSEIRVNPPKDYPIRQESVIYIAKKKIRF
jgi:voltage-gated potassium channel